MPTRINSHVSRLWCLHWPHARLPATDIRLLRASAVFLDTCLRQLAFGQAPRPRLATTSGGELYTGAAAYRLLLEVASGLRSAVPGETNVFGQFRRAWEQAGAALTPHAWQALRPIGQALLEDTRTLRAGHLQGLAGGSYGSLVRALLAPRKDARLLFIGTGELARSIIPLFRTVSVGVWNHRAGAPLTGICRWFTPEETDEAAAWATDIVFTTPRDTAHDTAWQLRLGRQHPRKIVHLGQRRDTAITWPAGTASFNLDDVFDLASARDQHRSRQLAVAARACDELVSARLAARPPAVSTSLALASA